jgi:hypothetical protein
MTHYDDFITLSSEDINKKLAKLLNMQKHYSIYKQQHMVETIDIMIETCYTILDERRYKVFDDELLKTSGVIIDTQKSLEEVTKKEKSDESNSRTKRRRITIV